MALIGIDETKQYLRVDSDYEDALIGILIHSAETLCVDVARMSIADWQAVNSDAESTDTMSKEEMVQARDIMKVRQIIDWMMYVEKYLNDNFWNAEYKDAAERCGLKKLAIISTRMCQKYLGLDPKIIWCQAGNYDKLCDEFLEYVVKRGNFGRKMGQSAGSLDRLRMLRNPIETIKTAQRHGTAKWKLLNKFPWLRPFAWIYQLTVWPMHAIQHGYTPKELLKNRKQANAEVDFFEKLKD